MRSIAVAVAAVVASSCMTLFGGAGRRVEVTSTPPDAQVFVDGEHVGATPVRVTVNGADPDPLITVEKEGHPTYGRRLQRSVSVWRTLGSVGIGAGLGLVATVALAVQRDSGSFDGFALLPLAVGGLGPVTDWQSGALFKFPGRVDARLASPAPGPAWSPERRRRERERWLREPGGRRFARGGGSCCMRGAGSGSAALPRKSGNVVDRRGNPAVGAIVHVGYGRSVPEADRLAGLVRGRVKSDAEGTFSIGGLAPDTSVALQAELDGRLSDVVTVHAVEPGMEQSGIVLRTQ